MNEPTQFVSSYIASFIFILHSISGVDNFLSWALDYLRTIRGSVVAKHPFGATKKGVSNQGCQRKKITDSNEEIVSFENENVVEDIDI